MRSYSPSLKPTGSSQLVLFMGFEAYGLKPHLKTDDQNQLHRMGLATR
jgi:hypothetical protein